MKKKIKKISMILKSLLLKLLKLILIAVFGLIIFFMIIGRGDIALRIIFAPFSIPLVLIGGLLQLIVPIIGAVIGIAIFFALSDDKYIVVKKRLSLFYYYIFNLYS